MGIFAGVYDFLRSITLIFRNPKLLGLALIPSALALIVSVISIYLSIHYGPAILHYIWTPSDSNGLIASILTGSIQLISSVASLIITPFLIIIVGFPLCEPLASTADEVLGGVDLSQDGVMGVIRGVITGLLVMFIGLLGGMILSILGLFPLIGPIAAGISLLIWAPFLICFDICEVGFTRQGYAFKQRINALRSMPFATISVGLVATFLISIPFLNLIGLPLAVVIGTLHVRRLSQNA